MPGNVGVGAGAYPGTQSKKQSVNNSRGMVDVSGDELKQYFNSK